MYPHQFPALPFELSALEPHISAETLNFHYNKHHKAYFEKMMKLLPGSGLEDLSLEEVVKKSTGPLFNNAAQNWNHTFYWESLTPKNIGAPQGALLDAIKKSFGSFEKFQQKFETLATELFGSGWVWLVGDNAGTLELLKTSNADTPIKAGKTPILTTDVWEHAYYIDYRNERPKYLKALWNLMNWDFAQANFERISNQKGQAA